MRHLIKTVVEPRRLILAWQAADLLGPRYRWAVGEISRRGEAYRFRYFLQGNEFAALNDGRPFAALRAAGYVGYPAFALGPDVLEKGVIDAFRRRLPARERSDYGEYLAHFRLSIDTPVSDFALLGLTGAKLLSDGFTIVDTLEDLEPARDIFLEVAGYRHYAAGVQLAGGEPVHFAAEPSNPIDRNAVALRVRDSLIGYINRLRTRAFHAWVAESRLTGVVERLNGRPDRPRAFVFVRVEARTERAAA